MKKFSRGHQIPTPEVSVNLTPVPHCSAKRSSQEQRLCSQAAEEGLQSKAVLQPRAISSTWKLAVPNTSVSHTFLLSPILQQGCLCPKRAQKPHGALWAAPSNSRRAAHCTEGLSCAAHGAPSSAGVTTEVRSAHSPGAFRRDRLFSAPSTAVCCTQAGALHAVLRGSSMPRETRAGTHCVLHIPRSSSYGIEGSPAWWGTAALQLCTHCKQRQNV